MTDQIVQPVEIELPADESADAVGSYRIYWYGKGMKKTRPEAIRFIANEGAGRQLADVPSDTWRTSLATYIDGPTWIGSWKGDNYNGANVVLHPNGSIGTVEDGEQELPFFISYIG
ncbi:hypothetical protein ACQPYK_05500 [Streptosporangium sp. CA-135522]|uniref:hypothetical protein n=1 Tax=Streptosporangium sp. CA-135522 TaxID=3240072 RepID=UPI003D91D705